MSHKITVLPSGREFYAGPGQTILDAALAAGVTLPYSCRDGACSTCKGRVLNGSFVQGPHQAGVLDAQETEQGYALFCCATPQSDLTVEARVVQGLDGIEIRKMPVRLKSLESAAPDVMILTLQLPANQHFDYNAGQYLDFMFPDGSRRSYSMASAPGAATLELHVRHMPGGFFTDRVFGVAEPTLKVRDILRCEAPLGSFFLREDSDKPIVLLASGTGFAPIKAMMEHMIRRDVRRPVRFYWGGRRPRDLYAHQLALGWRRELSDFEYIPVVSDALPEDGWSGRTGLVHRAVMADLPVLAGHQVYACGTPAMVDSARADFTRVCGLPEAEFHADAFTSQADSANKV